MSVTKPIFSMGLLLLLSACAQPGGHASNDSRDTLRRKTVHSQYIAKSTAHDPHIAYAKRGEYRNYGLVDAPLPPIAAGPAPQPYAPAVVSPTGSYRTVIDQVTNQPIRYGQAVEH